MSRPVVRVGSRRSELALAQTRLVIAAVDAAQPGLTFEIVTMDTTGDKVRRAGPAPWAPTRGGRR